MQRPVPNAVVAGSPAARVGTQTDSFWAAPGVMSQKGYLESIGNYGTAGSGGLYDYLNDWAKGKNKGIMGGNGQAAGWAEVMADLRNRGIDVSGLPNDAIFTSQQQAVAAQQQMAQQMASLSPQEANAFMTQRSGARSAYETLLASLGQEESSTVMNRDDQLRRFGNETFQQRQALPGSFVGRGMHNSGIMLQGLQDFTNQRAEGENSLRNQYSQLLDSIALKRTNAGKTLNDTLAQVDANEAARKAQLVADLRRYGLVSQ